MNLFSVYFILLCYVLFVQNVDSCHILFEDSTVLPETSFANFDCLLFILCVNLHNSTSFGISIFHQYVKNVKLSLSWISYGNV
jgi:hypothetical protein